MGLKPWRHDCQAYRLSVTPLTKGHDSQAKRLAFLMSTQLMERSERKLLCELNPVRNEISNGVKGVRMKRNRKREEGFNLYELVIVLAIVAILGVLAMPLFQNVLLMHQLRDCSEKIASHIRYVRKLAMDSGVPKQITFTVSSSESSYKVHDAGNPLALEKSPMDSTKDFVVKIKPPTGSVANPEFKGLILSAVCFDFNNDGTCKTTGSERYLVFNSSGVPFSNSTMTKPLSKVDGTPWSGHIGLKAEPSAIQTRFHVYVTPAAGAAFVGQVESP